MCGYLYAATSVILVTFAQLAMKWGMTQMPAVHDWSLAWTFVQNFIGPIVFVCLGLLAYLLSMISWMAALNSLSLNRAYPLLSISYGLVYVLAIMLPGFNESFSLVRSLGVCLIVAGVVLIHWHSSSNLEKPD